MKDFRTAKTQEEMLSLIVNNLDTPNNNRKEKWVQLITKDNIDINFTRKNIITHNGIITCGFAFYTDDKKIDIYMNSTKPAKGYWKDNECVIQFLQTCINKYLPESNIKYYIWC